MGVDIIEAISSNELVFFTFFLSFQVALLNVNPVNFLQDYLWLVGGGLADCC